MEQRTQYKKTFSAVELVIVVAFLLILAALAKPNAAF